MCRASRCGGPWPILRVECLLHDARQQPLQYLVVRSTPLRTRMLLEMPGQEIKSRGAGYMLHDAGMQA